MKTEDGFASGLTDSYITVMLLVFPLFTGFSGYKNLTLSKYCFFAAATCLWFALLFGYGIYSLIKRKNDIKCPKAPVTAVIIYMAVCSLSAIFSPYREYVFLGAGRYDGLATLLLYGMVFLGVSQTARPRRKYFLCLAVSCTLCCMVALLQLLDLDVLGLFPEGLGYYDHGVFYTGEFLGTIGNANLLSAFLCLCAPAFAAMFVTDRSMGSGLYLVSFFLALLVLIASRVAGGAVALAVCALAGAPVLVTDRRRLSRALVLLAAAAAAAYLGLAFGCSYENRTTEFYFSGVRWLPLMLAALALAVLSVFVSRGGMPVPEGRVLRRSILLTELVVVMSCLVVLYLVPWQSGTLYELSSVLHGEISDSFGSSRIGIWKSVLSLVPERPLLGGGPDTLALRLDMTFSRYVPETGKTLSVYVDNAHNEYLGILANTGILGLCTWLAIPALSAGRIFRGSSRLSTALGLSMICYWVQSFFGLGLCIVAPLMWLLWGLLCSDVPESYERKDTQQ